MRIDNSHDDELMQPLPADLVAIEQMLRSDSGDCRPSGKCDQSQPSADLCDRIALQVQEELVRSKRNDFWPFAAAVAASVMLLLNVSSSVSQGTIRKPSFDREKFASMYQQVEQMQLGLSDAEIRRQCLLWTAGSELLPLPMPSKVTVTKLDML